MLKMIVILFLLHSTLFGKSFLKADLDNDGKLEKVTWRAFAYDSEGSYYYLEVRDDDGSLIWRGPKVKEPTSPYSIVKLNYGVALPEILEDIDYDDNYELLIPEAQSDVSPTLYHRLRWIRDRFIPIKSAYLVFFRGTHNDRVQWMYTPPSRYGFWVSSLSPTPMDAARAHIIGYTPQNPIKPRDGVGVIRWAAGGGAVYKWIRPLDIEEYGEGFNNSENLIDNPENSSSWNSNNEWGENNTVGYTTRYIARISNRDHYNSGGVRLYTIRDIIHQDRANYYRYGGGDREDQSDQLFTTLQARNRISSMQIKPIGVSMQHLKRQIVYGTPLIEVTVKRNSLYVRLLDE